MLFCGYIFFSISYFPVYVQFRLHPVVHATVDVTCATSSVVSIVLVVSIRSEFILQAIYLTCQT